MIRMTTRSIGVRLLALAATLLVGAVTARASSISFSASVPLSATNWSSSMPFPKFDPALGCMDRVCFCLNGHGEGEAKFESLDGGPTTVTMNLAATLTLQRPDLSTLVVTFPVATTLDNVTAFDGVIDFGARRARRTPRLPPTAWTDAALRLPRTRRFSRGSGTSRSRASGRAPRMGAVRAT